MGPFFDKVPFSSFVGKWKGGKQKIDFLRFRNFFRRLRLIPKQIFKDHTGKLGGISFSRAVCSWTLWNHSALIQWENERFPQFVTNPGIVFWGIPLGPISSPWGLVPLSEREKIRSSEKPIYFVFTMASAITQQQTYYSISNILSNKISIIIFNKVSIWDTIRLVESLHSGRAKRSLYQFFFSFTFSVHWAEERYNLDLRVSL